MVSPSQEGKGKDMSISVRLSRHFVAASAAAVACAAASEAAVIRWNCNLSVPTNNVGFYINVQTQQTATNGTAVPGWDFQMYTPGSSPGLTIFCNTTTALQRSSNGVFTPANLDTTATVNASSPWSAYGGAYAPVFGSTASVPPGQWVFNTSNFFGFRFQASDGLQRYGYGRIDVGANANIRTLVYVEWESTPGVGIQIPAPGALALAAIAGLGRSRRRR
jgi:hypothetical protein